MLLALAVYTESILDSIHIQTNHALNRATMSVLQYLLVAVNYNYFTWLGQTRTQGVFIDPAKTECATRTRKRATL